MTCEQASVRPSVVRAGTPRRAHSSRSANGAAAPPTSTARRLASTLAASRSSSARSMVGTTERSVGRRRAMEVSTASASKRGSRITGRPAMRQRVMMESPPTWQSGIAQSQASRSVQPRFAALPAAAARSARRESTAPLARPEVPEV